MQLSLRGIQKSLGGSPILRGIDLDVADGELVVLVGPSGCGKSTLLRTIAGLETPDAGTIRIGDRDVTHAAPRERDVGMVFQSYALYPHLTVRDNLAFGLSIRGTEKKTIDARIDEVAGMLGLEKLLARYPREMSGGQRQRVAMGRAIARRPALFLFDEPLSNLDAALRSEVRVEIKRLHARLSATMIYVTHDQVEAMTLADRLVVLRAGAIEQVGAPLDVYEKPVSRFVAGFLGSPAMNFLEGSVVGGAARGAGFEIAAANGDGAVVIGVRPQDLEVQAEGGIVLRVEVIEAMGFEAYAHGKVGDVSFVARLTPSELAIVRVGQDVRLAPKRVHLFHPKTERALDDA
jgi:multiple sugar transport system ATP-binding protein